jgi:hypothetical protein
MIRNLFSADWLSAQNNRGYGTLPIPQARDGEISNPIATWMNLNEPSRNESALQISLIALGLDGWRFDWRENIIILSLHYDAAERIGVKPEFVFEKAAALLNEKVASALHSFIGRPVADKSLEAMGYIAAVDNQGFRYRRTW